MGATEFTKSAYSSAFKTNITKIIPKITDCMVVPESANPGDIVDFHYILKAKRSANLTAAGIKSDGSKEEGLKLPIKFNKKRQGAKQGIIQIQIPDSWSIYKEIIFTLTSGGEIDHCKLTLSTTSTFEINDPDSKTVTIDGKTISVSELKDLLYNVGLLTLEQKNTSNYTAAVRDAWKLFNYITKTCDTNNLLAQTVPSEPIMGSCTENVILDANGNPLPLPDPNILSEPTIDDLKNVIVFKDLIEGLVQGGVSSVRDILNPTSIGIIASIVALTATGIITIPGAIITLSVYGGSTVSAYSLISEISGTFSSKSISWKVGYGIGRLGVDLAGIKGVAGLKKNGKISEEASKILNLDNATYKESAEFLKEEEKLINLLNIAEEERNIKRDQLGLFAESLYESLQRSDINFRQKINTLIKDLDDIAKADLRENVIFRKYPKDLNDTAELNQVVKEKILSPTIENSTKAKELGAENRFLFKNEFVNEIDGQTYNSLNISDLQAQGYLLGGEVSQSELPAVVYRIINNHDPLTMLAGNKSGAVFTFDREGLTKEGILNSVQNNRSTFLKNIGLNPLKYQGSLKLLEIKVKDGNITLYKPTNKDSNFNELFRCNNSVDSYGTTLDLNGGAIDNMREYVLKEYQLPNELINEIDI